MYQNTLLPNEEEKGEEHTFVFDLGAFRKLYVCMYVTGGDEDWSGSSPIKHYPEKLGNEFKFRIKRD